MPDSCFIIQPFEAGKFDKRFKDILEPAVKDSGLEPYRVDRDPSVTIPIEEIEAGIQSARMCVADITSDNPNVWFELGYALALNKDVCLISSKERLRFPFDVQHRKVIQYETESSSDFEALRRDITERLQAIIKKQAALTQLEIPSVTKTASGLQDHETACIAAIAAEVEGLEFSLSNYRIKKAMEALGYNNLATQAALRKLIRLHFVSMGQATDVDGTPFEDYTLTETGWDWIGDNLARLKITAPKRRSPPKDLLDDEIPF